MATLLHALLAMTLLVGTASARPQNETDVQLIIGGNFAEDHIGPAPFAAVKQRALAQPLAYLAIIERLARVGTPQWLSSTHVPYAIAWIGVKHPAELKTLATRLLPIYRKARVTPIGTDTYRNERLDDRIRDLVRLAK